MSLGNSNVIVITFDKELFRLPLGEAEVDPLSPRPWFRS